ncbi:MAG: TIGR03915 family putative DNA repair protein [Pseudobacteriovorax sp.]|nr:TIGR03915 family putative DNA repair protein [Pseudobacteriovorax sp.]
MATFSSFNFDQWRDQARLALSQDLGPETVHWNDLRHSKDMDLFQSSDTQEYNIRSKQFHLNRQFIGTLSRLSSYRDPQRWNFLYRLLWRYLHEGAEFLDDPLDGDVRQMHRWSKELGRDSHKCKAFLRFRKQPEGFYQARYASKHYVLKGLVEYFSTRFAAMDFEIITPWESLRWFAGKAQYTESGEVFDAIDSDDFDDLWLTYYRNTYNPARLNMKATLAEMPKYLWKNMPETELIPEMIATSDQQVDAMLEAAPKFQLDTSSLNSLTDVSRAVSECRACLLCDGFGNAVPGRGQKDAAIMIVGEQPGDHEEKAGKPFVGPSGKLLAKILREESLGEESIYLTNTVKHFRHRKEGARRIHMRPSQTSIHACRAFLIAEIQIVRPQVILCLGITSSRALRGVYAQLNDAEEILDFGFGEVKVISGPHPAAIMRAAGAKREQLLFDLKQRIREAVSYPGTNDEAPSGLLFPD